LSPSRRLVGLGALALALAVAAAFLPPLVLAWWLLVGGIALAAALDAALAFGLGPFDAKRSLPHSLAVGTRHPVGVELVNRGRGAARLLVFDHVPASFGAIGLPRRLDLASGATARFSYEIAPSGRGEMRIGALELVAHPPLGLWRRRLRAGSEQHVRVYPNFRAVSRYELLAAANRTGGLGIRRRRQRGEGLEFHQLREYRQGDSLRQIDWKATARLRRAVSREYEEERDQQIVFLLDCGRKMHARDGALSHFDHALDALLLLAHVALRQGDAVGLLAFGGAPRWLAPRKGAAHLDRVMNSVYDLESSTRASDYLAGAQDLASRLAKRALVVVISNLRDEEHEELRRAAKLLGHRHLVLVASMKERALSAALETKVRDLDSALSVAATHQYLLARHRAHERLRRSGVLALDAEPQKLAIALVNGYLDVKAAGVL
jgi:uncharacterized protein (DUF58 family)